MRPFRSLAITMLIAALLAGAGSQAAAQTPAGAQAPGASSPTAGPVTLSTLTPETRLGAFEALHLYTIAGTRPVGARFRHRPTGVTVDLLRFDSVPQAMTWVATLPPSDMGEPHTAEHLVLGKGRKARLFSLALDMSIGSHSAATWRSKTIYHFHTAGGRNAFLELAYRSLDALVHPDCTDEEIRREVCHLGITRDDASGERRLEEKGTVYLEMQSAFERPGTILWTRILQLCYGDGHPLARVSGGRPEAIRELQPEAMRAFFREQYQLQGGRMGLILALPEAFPLAGTLQDLDGILGKLARCAPDARGTTVTLADRLPPARPVRDGRIERVPFSAASAATPGQAVLAWPPHATLEATDQIALEALWHLLAEGESAYLQRDLVDRSKRRGPAGVARVEGFLASTEGQPPMIWLSGMNPSVLAPDSLAQVRAIIMERLRWIAELAPDDPAFAELRERARTYLIADRRGLLEGIDRPPRFGFRGTGDFWYRHLQRITRAPDFAQDLLLDEPRAAFEAALGAGNPWAGALERWQLTPTPVLVAAYPDTAMPARLAEAKDARLREGLAQLARRYAAADPQEALAHYAAEESLATARLDSLEESSSQPAFLVDPPLTLDDLIDTRLDTLRVPGATSGVPLCVNTFDHAAVSDFGLYYDLTRTPRADWIYLPLLPALLTDLGAWGADSAWIPYDELAVRLRKEVGSLTAAIATHPREEGCRVEWAIYGSGLDAQEATAAVAWAEGLLLSATRLAPVALPRLRDLVAREIARLREMPLGSEESWVRYPARSYRYQRDGVFLSAQSIFTRRHHLQRLAWRLHPVPPATAREALRALLARLAAQGEVGGGPVAATLDSLIAGSRPVPGAIAPELVREVADYLRAELDGLPAGTLPEDLHRLGQQIVADLERDPARVLADLSRLTGSLLAHGPARLHLTASRAHQAPLRPALEKLLARCATGASGAFGERPAPAARLDAQGFLVRNLRRREPALPAGERPVRVALLHPSARNGLFTNSAPLITYQHVAPARLIDYLTARVFGGRGAHGLFMQTWAAGLAYSNGIGCSPRQGLVSYYAERCSDAAATMRFVTGLLRAAPETLDDPYYLDYALASTFTDYRAADTYVGRGRAMAADLADGLTPPLVRRFKRALLALREEWRDPERAPEILARVLARLPEVAGPVLLDYGASPSAERGAVVMVIGPESQVRAVEALAPAGEAPLPFVRLWPRDFWIDVP